MDDADPPTPSLADRLAAREARRAQLEDRIRQRELTEAILEEYDRPRTRGDCAGGERPCPWAGCRYHLLIDVNPETGLLKIQDIEIENMAETCALDVADRGGLNQPDTAALLGVSRQRVDQLEKTGIRFMIPRVDHLR